MAMERIIYMFTALSCVNSALADFPVKPIGELVKVRTSRPVPESRGLFFRPYNLSVGAGGIPGCSIPSTERALLT